MQTQVKVLLVTVGVRTTDTAPPTDVLEALPSTVITPAVFTFALVTFPVAAIEQLLATVVGTLLPPAPLKDSVTHVRPALAARTNSETLALMV